MTQENRCWEDRYQKKDTPWDSGIPSTELTRCLDQFQISPCRVLEMGCGTGTNAVFLAQKGFQVTAVDLSSQAIEEGRMKARQAGVQVDFRQADVLNAPEFGEPFAFLFDRGFYHVARRVDLEGFQKVLHQHSEPGSLYLTLAGNANEASPEGEGPPRVHAHEMCLELSTWFDLVVLHEFRFDGIVRNGHPFRPLGWSGLWRRKA
ncbi:MAG: hypothetical protein AMXMBFR75_26890 [Candidatus Hinthialibacteria bacterium]